MITVQALILLYITAVVAYALGFTLAKRGIPEKLVGRAHGEAPSPLTRPATPLLVAVGASTLDRVQHIVLLPGSGSGVSWEIDLPQPLKKKDGTLFQVKLEEVKA